MLALHSASGTAIRLDPGEEVLTRLTEFVQESNLSGGTISGIGAVKNATLGFYDLHRREYLRRDFPDEMELVSFTANVTWVEDKPFIHAHATLSGSDFLARSGHLFSAEIAVTGEFFFSPSDHKLRRVLDERTGLKLISG
jgi:uncharacterized protein